MIEFDKPGDRTWTVIYRLNQRTAAITIDSEAERDRASAPTIDSIENPDNNKAEGLAAGGYIVTIRGKNLQTVKTVSFGPNKVQVKPENANVLLLKVPAGAEGGVHVLLNGCAGLAPGCPRPVSNIMDFATPGKAIFKYISPPKPPVKEEEKPTEKPSRRRP